MFSSMFTLLLAGSMVSQVFSSKVLLVVFDSVNANFISDTMPDLNVDGPIGQYIARPARLKSVNPTLSFSTLHTVATGCLASIHGIVANKMFADDNSEIINTIDQYNRNNAIKPLWVEAMEAGKRTATFMWPGSHLQELYKTTPTIIEEYEYNTNADWESHTEKIIKWFKDERIEFGMAYFEDTNRMETVVSYTARVKKAIENIYNGLKDTDVDIIIMSNYGTKNVPKDHVLKIDDFAPKDQYHYNFIPAGPISFVRSNNDENLTLTYEHIKSQPKFEVYRGCNDDTGLSKWGLNSFSLVRKTLVLTTLDGYTFYDQNKYDALNKSSVRFVRENGYNRDDPDMDGMLVFRGPSFKDNVFTANAEIELTEVYQLIKRLLRLTNIPSIFQRINNLSQNMRDLIDDKTLVDLDKLKFIRPSSGRTNVLDGIYPFSKTISQSRTSQKTQTSEKTSS